LEFYAKIVAVNFYFHYLCTKITKELMNRHHSYIYFAILISLIMAACHHVDHAERKADSAKADSLMQLAMEAADSLQYKRAISYNQQALDIYAEINDSSGLSDCYSEIGALYHNLGDFSASIEAFTAGLDIDEATHNAEQLSSSYNNLAATYLAAKQADKGREFIIKAIQVERSLPKPEKLSTRYGIASEIYVALDSFPIALDYAKKAFSIDSTAHDTLRMGRRLSQMGDVYQAQGDFGKAEQSYKASLQYLAAANDAYSLCIDFKQLGILSMRSNRLDEANGYFQQSLGLAKLMNNHYFLMLDYDHLAELYSETEPKQAYMYKLLASDYQDSVFSQKTAELTSNFKARYDFAEQEHVIEQQKAKLDKNRLVLGGSLVTMFLLITTCLVLYFLLRQRAIKEKALRNLIMVAGQPATSSIEHIAAHDKPAVEPAAPESSASDAEVSSAADRDPDRDFLNRLTSLIRDHIDQPDLNAIYLAPYMQLTRHQLTAKVRSLTGLSANNFITRVRLDQARKLLRTTDKTVSEIAWECGFQDMSYFGRVFKDVYEQTPTQYRKPTD